MLEIVKYTDEKEKVIELLTELQNHLVRVDDEKVQILKDSYGESYFALLFQRVEKYNGVVFLAKAGNEIVGMIAGYVEPKDEEDMITNRCPKRGIIAELIVSSQFRSQGVGTELMNALEQYFYDIGCEFIAVSVFAPNKSAESFYEHLGYAPRNIELYKRILRN